ncbi:uncharacterized protein RAG0_05821 [Rhynchosporium agropyri]|uniref:Aminoglycoside phosphotransferase domain-containing protein n=1 Tax=Rhynchosporium agropyri TaxID=914238 RepID=A0A1E1KEW9_9HELO|nr:uncharacterized protein RAG0_05821 [Rhynchosporium agropyri]
MASQDLNHETASNDEIAAYCSNADHASLSEVCYDIHVVKLSEDAVVKFGLNVKEEEATSLRRACELVDQDIPVEEPVVVRRIADILAYLTIICGSVPGPLGGGESCGILWSEHSEEPLLHSVEEMEIWFNRRLRKQDHKLGFGESVLVLCHLDLAPRNFLLLEDGSVCLLDWASAGFCPRVFEECAIRVTRGLQDSFDEDALKLKDSSEKEEVQISSMMQAYYNTVRYHFRPQQAIHVALDLGHDVDNIPVDD